MERPALEFGERIEEEADEGLDVDRRLLRPRDLLSVLGVRSADSDRLVELRGVQVRMA